MTREKEEKMDSLQAVCFRPGERNVFFHILTQCNLRCRHCYINPAQHGTEMLSAATVISWLRLFHDPLKKSNLVFLGGEPTLHPDLAFCIEEAKKLDFSVSVDTNGYLFHELLARSSPQHLDFLSFSLDGPDSMTNDALRGTGCFAVCTENIKKAIRAGYTVGVITTVSGENIGQLPRMIPLLQGLQVKRFFIQVVGLRGHAYHEAQLAKECRKPWQVEVQQWQDVVPEVARRGAEAGIHVTYPVVYLDAHVPFLCAGRVAENYFLFPNGRVYLCPLCEDYPLHSYRIEEMQLLENTGITEKRLFTLDIAEGCVMNKLLQPSRIAYDPEGNPVHRISCCLLKQAVHPA